MKRILTAREAAGYLGCPAQLVRERLRKGIWTFGRAIPPNEKKTWTYEIYTEKLLEYIKGK